MLNTMNGNGNRDENRNRNGNGTNPEAWAALIETPDVDRRPLVTFLFTDLEKSTECWERFPEEMERMLLRHFDLMQEVVEAEGGRIFKTVGDACLAVFEDPAAALRAAFLAQEQISRAEWARLDCKRLRRIKVRMALHTGRAISVRGDYLGSEVCRTARIVDAGHGGQVLLSNATRELVRGRLPEGCVLLDKGLHRLKSLVRPERIFQLGAESLPLVRRPLRTVLRLDGPAQGAGGGARRRASRLQQPREGLYRSLNEAIGHG